MASSDFSWSDDQGDIVLTWQPRTAVFRNGGNGVTIRQEADAYSDDRGDDQVFLTPMGALQVAWKLIEIAHECGIAGPPRKLMTKPLDLGPTESPIPLTHPEPVTEPGPLLRAMERGAAGKVAAE
jgi:hypothetical protein